MSAFNTATTTPVTIQVPDNGFARHIEDCNTKMPEIAQVTMYENEIRKKIAKGEASIIEGLVNITPQMISTFMRSDIPNNVERLFSSCPKKNSSGLALRDGFTKSDEFINKILSIPNVVIAGGHALASTTPDRSAEDIDVFIWGCSEAEAAEKIKKIFDISEAVAGYKSDHAITLFGYHQIQIILRLYKSPAEILHGFDLPASKVLLVKNPSGVIEAWCTQSYLLCLKYNSIWTDPERQSQTYTIRLLKYYNKGFNVLLFGLDRNKINMKIFYTPLVSLKGMAQIVKAEQLLHEKQYSDNCYNNVYYNSHYLKKMFTMSGLPSADYDGDYGMQNLKFSRRDPNNTGTVTTYERYGYKQTEGTLENAILMIKWRTQDPGSQTVIGSFHPENFDFFAGL